MLRCARCLRWAGRAALIVAAVAVVYGMLLRIGWLPRTYSVTVRAAAEEKGGTLWLYPHVGRGYHVGDATSLPIKAGARSYSFDIPVETRAARIKLKDRAAAVVIEGAEVAGVRFEPGDRGWKREKGGVVLLAPLSRILPAPAWFHALALALAVCLIGLVVVVRPVRRALVDLVRASVSPGRLLTVRGALAVTATGALAVLVLAACVDVCSALVGSIDNPPFWPMSVFEPRFPGQAALMVACLVLLGFRLAVPWALARDRAGLLCVIAIALVTAFVSNALGGIDQGFLTPLLEPNSYYRDALEVRDPLEFLSTYTDRQLSLNLHSRTHPPGAVLVYRGLHAVLRHPLLVSAVLGAAVIAVMSVLMYLVARRPLGHRGALVAALLFSSLPAPQIYVVSTLDALVCPLFFAVFFYYLRWPSRAAFVGFVVTLFASLFVTFGALFLLPLLVGHAIWARRSVGRLALALLLVALLYVLIDLATGFDWWRSFLIASARENPQGFRLLAGPTSYLVTRLEDVVEILVFLGPICVCLAWRGLAVARTRWPEMWAGSALAFGALALMFLAGSFKTGETARACLFVVPFVVLPVASLAGPEGEIDDDAVVDLLCLVMTQSLIMQLVGDFYW